MKKQKAVRTATPSNRYWYEPDKMESLVNALDDGWIVVMCNPIVRKDGEQWLEYILEKEI